jgi:drug/metabolite transporter (DMT)-like permease
MLMGLMYTAQSQGYFNALLYASSGLCGMLLYVYPVLVTILALTLGWEKLDRRMLVLLALAIAGMAITLGGKLQGQPIGIALALMAAGVYAVYILFGNSLAKRPENIHPLAACVVILGTAGMANSAIALWQGVSLPGTATGWLAVCTIALFSTAIAIAAFFAGVAQIGAARASIISTFEPVITMAFGVTMLHEKVSGTQLLGGAMVLAAVVLLAHKPAAKPALMPGAQASA